MLGTFILWFGWYGFNSGSALIATSSDHGKLVSLSAVNTTLSGGMGGLVALFTNLFILERRMGEPIFDLRMAMNGSLSGLVAITAGCGVGELSDIPVTAFVWGKTHIIRDRLLTHQCNSLLPEFFSHQWNHGPLYLSDVFPVSYILVGVNS